MDKNEKNTSNDYRQERKERISKQAKSAAKKSNSHPGAKSVAGKVVGIIIAVVVVVAILASMLNFFGVPQKAIKAVTIDGKSYSMSELSCYYMQIYQNVYSYSSQYDSNYGEGYGKMLTGYDTAVSPTKQTTTDHDGNEVTWDEYFLDEAIESMANVKRYYKTAVDAGITLSEEDEEEIQSAIDDISENINNSGLSYSVSRYITLTYGKGVTTKLYKKVLTERKYVELYQELRQDELKAGYTDGDVNAVYTEDKSAYDVVDFRWYTIDVESSETAEEESTGEDTSEAAETLLPEEERAQRFIDTVKSEQNYNEDTFKQTVLDFASEDSEDYETYKIDSATLLQKISKSVLESNIGEDAANWFYETDDSGNYVRQTGDMNYFLDSDGDVVYIVFTIGTPYCDDTIPASVRHILVQYPTEEASEDVSGEAETEATTVSAEMKSECESEAESILNEYKTYIEENESGAADEEYFGELASKYSDDTGSVEEGGLISDMSNNGSYVDNFEDWVFAEGQYDGETRAEGDTAVIETEYGYHIMYFVGGHDHPEWYETILSDLANDAWEEEQTSFEESFGEDAIVRKETVEKWVKKSCLKIIGGD